MSNPAGDPTNDERVGQTIGAYRIEGVLGTGGMGRVYRAVAPDGTHVALKLVQSDLARDPVFRRRFDREARIAQRVKHVNLVPVLDTGEHDGIPYLTQKLVPNGSLEQRLKNHGALDVDAAIRICLHVAAGLDALNAAGVVHRDVKPGNILLDEEDNAYITDFGLVKDKQASVLTRPGQALGSLDYMAPEQIRGEDLTPCADVYALGCVMFECICGTPPFADRNGMRVLWAHLQDDPPNPSSRRPDVPEELDGAILSALEKDPTKRPQSSGEFARLLQRSTGMGQDQGTTA